MIDDETANQQGRIVDSSSQFPNETNGFRQPGLSPFLSICHLAEGNSDKCLECNGSTQDPIRCLLGQRPR